MVIIYSLLVKFHSHTSAAAAAAGRMEEEFGGAK
jgi:hypothetical protein